MRKHMGRYQGRGSLRSVIMLVCFATVIAPLGVLLEPIGLVADAAQSDTAPESTAAPAIEPAPTEAPAPPTEAPLPPTEVPPPPTEMPPPTDVPPPPTEVLLAPTEAPLPTEVPGVSAEAPAETPYQIPAGWQDDPSIPWTLVVDQNPTTTWSGYVANVGDDIELGFDLGSMQPIRDMEWLPSWPMQGVVDVQLSTDGIDWYQLRRVDLNQQYADTWFTIPVGYLTRYVRLMFQLPEGSTGQVGSLAEIAIWLEPSGSGETLAALQLVTPVPTTKAPLPTDVVEPTSTPASQQGDVAPTSVTSVEISAAEPTLVTETAVLPSDGPTGTVSGTGEDGLRCRTEPSLDAPVITVLPEGTSVVIRGEQLGDWLPVTCDGVDGYVAAAYVSVDESAGEAAPVVPDTQTTTPTETPVPSTSTATSTPTVTASSAATPTPTEAAPEIASPSARSASTVTPSIAGTPETAAQSRIAVASSAQEACVTQTATFSPTADAMVYESNPTTSYGSGYELRARTGVGRQYESYLNFTVTGTNGGVSKATLTLTSTSYTGSDTASAPEVRLVTGAWTESEITWNTKPGTAGVVAPGGTAWGLGAPYSWDVTSAVNGDGTISLALIPNSPDTVNANSREQGGGRPTLSVEYGCSGASPTPVPEPPSPTVAPSTPSATPSATAPPAFPTSTATSVASPTSTTTPTGTPAPTATASCVSQSATFVPTADAMVYESNPTTSYGSGYELRARTGAGRQYESYLAFNVSGTSGGVSRAQLTLTSANYTGSDTASAPEVRLVTGGWTESGITWATKPATGGLVAPGGTAWGLGAPYTWDVTAAVTGDGSVSLALIPNSPDTVNANSREQGGGRPMLTVEYGCGGVPQTPAPGTSTPAPTTTPPLPTATSTATVAASPTSTGTPTAVPATPTAGTPPATPTQVSCTPSTFSFVASADAFVSQTSPATNYGSGSELRVRLQPGQSTESYLAFDVSGLTDTVTSATLRLQSPGYSGAGTESAPDVVLVTGAWSETSISWNTKPGLGTTVAQGGSPWDANTSYTWDVTSALPGNGAISLALIGSVPDQVTAHSREQGSAGTAGQPTLIVTTCGGEASPTATPGTTATPAGTATPVPSATPTPSTGGVTLVAVGDIACAPGKPQDSTHCQQQATANTAAGAGPGAVLVLGDNQYECGSSAEFAGSYDPSWGQLKGVTHPVVGNHEYNWGDGVNPPCPGSPMPSGAEGYWNYFGEAATPLQPGCRSNCLGYYSFDVGDWHVVVLNSMLCGPLGSNQCWNGSAQETWLQNDLQGRSNQCVLAAWHHPLYSTGERAPGMGEIWNTLYENGAEIVLAGHLHRYEQFGPQDAFGNASPYGLREFVVGTGGKNLHDWSGRGAANLEVVNDTSFGVLRLNLTNDGYSWQFLSAGEGQFSTSGSDTCHGAPGAATSTESLPSDVQSYVMVMNLTDGRKLSSTRRRSQRHADLFPWFHGGRAAHRTLSWAGVRRIRPRVRRPRYGRGTDEKETG